MATLTKSTGTVTLTGAVEKVNLPAVYGWVWLKNMSEGNIFAGLSADISEGADGVMTIPAGECGRLQTDGSDSVYLMGLGNALVVAQNYADCPFKSGAKGGEIPDLSAYAKKSDIPTKLPADGGNADTVGGLHADEIANNPNLLINPDFKINQRGDTSVVSSYSGLYCVDRWRVNGTCTQTSSGVTVSSTGSSYGYGNFYQIIENIPSGSLSLSVKCYGKIFELTGIDASAAYSAELSITDGNGTIVGKVRTSNSDGMYAVEFMVNSSCEIQIEWVKLEVGSIATPFVSPDPATELMKCQRYYQIRSGNNIPAVDMRPNMRDGVNPTITELTDGNYSYSAEL